MLMTVFLFPWQAPLRLLVSSLNISFQCIFFLQDIF